MIIPPLPSKLECALAYAGQGFFVFPLHTPTNGICSCRNKAHCQDAGKHPRTRNGVKDATHDEKKIHEWWTRWPDANSGIATGSRYGFFVLDIDGDEGRDSLAERERKHGSLPKTVCATTGKGEHFYFKCNEPIKNRIRFAPGLDIRGDGGMVVAPGSIHANGRRYEWINPPDEIPMAEAPAWLLDMVRHDPAKQTSKGIPEGKRNETLFKLACSLRAKGYGKSEIYNRIRGEQCNPPLSDLEIRKIASSCSKYEPPKVIQFPTNDTPPKLKISWAKMPTRALYDLKMLKSKNYLLILGIIASRVISQRDYATIRQRTIIDLIKVNRPERPVCLRTVQRTIKRLEKWGYLKVTLRKEETQRGYINTTYYEVIYEPEKEVEYETSYMTP